MSSGATGSWAWRGWGSARARGRRGRQFGFTAGGEKGLHGALLAIALLQPSKTGGMDNRYEWRSQVGNRWMEGEGELRRNGDGDGDVSRWRLVADMARSAGQGRDREGVMPSSAFGWPMSGASGRDRVSAGTSPGVGRLTGADDHREPNDYVDAGGDQS